MTFPPIPLYPNDIDTDRTLYVVNNTVETRCCSDNLPWSQEIDIIPVAADKPEIWSENGFANIEGELFYYDSVEKDENGKINKLKGCVRQLGGEKTKFNKSGTWVRSYVIAEHHNQLVDCVLKTQDFVGRDFDPRKETLDWRIRNLQNLDVIFDDFACPDINFTFNVIENDPALGILTEYSVEITPPGAISSFRLDFGDGEFTTTDLTGEHRYALNARVDPVVRASNDKCEMIQTPIERTNPAEPTQDIDTDFDFPIPEVPDIPDFNFVPFEVPPPDINIPPLIQPFISVSTPTDTTPSVIVNPPVQINSQIVVVNTPPINVTQSVIQIVGGDEIPPVLMVDPPIPPTLVVDPPIPPTIVLLPPISNITLDLDVTELPRLEVDWGTPPDMEVALTFARQVKTPEMFAANTELVEEFGKEFSDLFEVDRTMKVEYESVGFPTDIKVIVPDDMKLKLDSDELFSKKIKIDTSDVHIPTEIKIYGPDSPIPNSIKLDGSSLPDSFELIYKGEPIPVDGSNLPKSISIEMEKEIPHKIIVEVPKPIPDKIVLEIPESLPISIPEDVYLPVKFPDKMPEVEMVYRGSPIEVKITMDEIVSKNADGKNCFMLVPCGK